MGLSEYSLITITRAVVIFVPPAAPITSLTAPSSPTFMNKIVQYYNASFYFRLPNIAGHMDESGRFPPRMKLFGDGGTPK